MGRGREVEGQDRSNHVTQDRSRTALNRHLSTVGEEHTGQSSRVGGNRPYSKLETFIVHLFMSYLFSINY